MNNNSDPIPSPAQFFGASSPSPAAPPSDLIWTAISALNRLRAIVTELVSWSRAEDLDATRVDKLAHDAEHDFFEAIEALRAAQAPAAPRTPELVGVVDGRCDCKDCRARTENIYRMVGRCLNCGTKPILMLFRSGDPVRHLDCPRCGKWHGVGAERRATDDEIPVAASDRQEPRTPQPTGWQPIATAPKDGTLIIGALIRDGRIWRISDMKHSGLAFYTLAGGSLPQMTHWKPAPSPDRMIPGDPTKEIQ